jgi:hypothetical protein
MEPPGYMHLALFFAGKIDSLIHREINSVTAVVDQNASGNKKITFLSSTISPSDNISMFDETSSIMSVDYTTCSANMEIDTPAGKPKAL